MLKIGLMRDPRLRIKRAIPVMVQRAEREMMVWSRPLLEGGYGQCLSDAIVDFARNVAQVYWFLKEHEDSLGPGPAQKWKFMQAYIEERVKRGEI